jgi:hydrogenase nickel incorporation protein HypB
MIPETRLVQVRAKALKENDVEARALRKRFEDAGTLVVSLVSSPGAGKTTLLEATLARLADRHRVGALVGDLATDNDARRLARSGAPVRQITTGTLCHLEAKMVRRVLEEWTPGALDVLFIENVGNLVCPASYDLGEALRVVLFSVAEGDDKPLKYPTIFNTSDVAVLSKIDLLGSGDFNPALARANLQAVRPGMDVLELSVRTGRGFDAWLVYLTSRLSALRAARPVAKSLELAKERNP